MKLHVDPEADALYLRLNESKIIDSDEVSPGVVLDYDAKDEVVGVEILHLSKRTSPIDIDRLIVQTTRARQSEAASVHELPGPYGGESKNKG
jgi:uncharacterized protein YuzE